MWYDDGSHSDPHKTLHSIFFIWFIQDLFEDYEKKASSRPASYQEIDPTCLSWIPRTIQDEKT